MKTILLGVLAIVWSSVMLSANRACAQAAVPTTVQLPTFHYFTSTGTVVVPDGGDAFLGGDSGAAAGRTERGIPGLPSRPFTNSAMGSSTVTGNASVSAQIHDFDAMDRALLGRGPTNGFAVRPPLATREQLAAAKLGAEPLQSVKALEAKVAAEDAVRDQTAAAALARGRQLLAAGKPGVAKIYFQDAIKQSSPTGEVRKQADAALVALEQPKSAGKVAGQ